MRTQNKIRLFSFYLWLEERKVAEAKKSRKKFGRKSEKVDKKSKETQKDKVNFRRTFRSYLIKEESLHPNLRIRGKPNIQVMNGK